MSYRFSDITISDLALKKVKKYQLVKQFKKAISYIENWDFKTVKFKLREPKSEKVWYFRINKQYRAWCKIIDNVLYIFDINDHS